MGCLSKERVAQAGGCGSCFGEVSRVHERVWPSPDFAGHGLPLLLPVCTANFLKCNGVDGWLSCTKSAARFRSRLPDFFGFNIQYQYCPANVLCSASVSIGSSTGSR